METKYYTPEIGEFHVGFEFEWNNPNEDDVWRSSVADLESCYHAVQDIQQKSDLMQYRVKYLDADDIRSLGYRLDILYGFTNGVYCILDLSSGIEIIKKDEPGKTLFTGVIKNKSELKKILEQVKQTNEVLF